MNLARREQTLTYIDDLHHALARVKEGTYGTCENCGNPINPERLEALPTATLCLDCAQQQEANAGLEL
jgi:RNA polymerase-binding protein DksA